VDSGWLLVTMFSASSDSVIGTPHFSGFRPKGGYELVDLNDPDDLTETLDAVVSIIHNIDRRHRLHEFIAKSVVFALSFGGVIGSLEFLRWLAQ
jgi:hypothetical protein